MKVAEIEECLTLIAEGKIKEVMEEVSKISRDELK